MLDSLERYYANRINQKGPSHEAVDWGSADRQHLAFRQVLKILEDPVTGQLARRFSLLDYGCGYGVLLPYLREHGFDLAAYTGYDMTPAMIEAAPWRVWRNSQQWVHYQRKRPVLCRLFYRQRVN
jgi:SAM-dependent methyltransferase